MPLPPVPHVATLTDVQLRWVVARHINYFGWHVSAWAPVETTPDPYQTYCTYTVGLTKRYEHPELVLFGLEPHIAYMVLGALRDRVVLGAKFEHGQRVPGLFQGPIEGKKAIGFRHARTDHPVWLLRAAHVYYKGPFQALQAVLPDEHDLYPWDEGCDELIRTRQPLLEPVDDTDRSTALRAPDDLAGSGGLGQPRDGQGARPVGTGDLVPGALRRRDRGALPHDRGRR